MPPLNLGATAPVITLKESGSGQSELLDLCKNYWDSMAVDTCVFIHMNAITSGFGFILKGRMGSGVGIIKIIKGATGEVISYHKTYNSNEWVASTF